jgi:diketogulonate reductase-like aldo/keto reductase
MQRLGIDVLDLYLIHWPLPGKGLAADTWRAMEKLYHDGRIRAIGVSNFHPHHLRALIDHADVVPTVNQVELHPYLAQHRLREYLAKHGIAHESWSPLGQGGELLSDPAVTAIATAHDASPAQVVIAWHLGRGSVVIPKSVTPSRIEENLAAADLTLTDDEMAAIDALDKGGRIGPHPDDVR